MRRLVLGGLLAVALVGCDDGAPQTGLPAELGSAQKNVLSKESCEQIKGSDARDVGNTLEELGLTLEWSVQTTTGPSVVDEKTGVSGTPGNTEAVDEPPAGYVVWDLRPGAESDEISLTVADPDDRDTMELMPGCNGWKWYAPGEDR